jgi:glycosyltransferase involved in cell wall biosynthesis
VTTIGTEASAPPTAAERSSEAPADGAATRPLITYALRFYNCERFVAPALESAFAQSYRPLEIVVADDHSTDRSFEIAERMVRDYRGPHRVQIFRNERNRGVGGQIMEILRRMRGEILVIADGDDISLPTRCARVAQAFRDGGPELMGVDCQFDLIDEAGRPISGVPAAVAGAWPDAGQLTAAQIARGRAGPHGAVAAFRRGVLEAGTALEVRHSEDRILDLRAALLGRLATIKEVLVLRRVHAANVSGAVAPAWTGAKLQAWFADDTKRRVAVAAVMQRDVAKLERDGRIAPATAAQVRADIRAYAREVKLLRVAPRLGLWRGWWVYRALRRLGVGGKEGVRLLLSQLAPSLAMMFLRRNPLIRTRASAARDPAGNGPPAPPHGGC